MPAQRGHVGGVRPGLVRRRPASRASGRSGRRGRRAADVVFVRLVGQQRALVLGGSGRAQGHLQQNSKCGQATGRKGPFGSNSIPGSFQRSNRGYAVSTRIRYGRYTINTYIQTTTEIRQIQNIYIHTYMGVNTKEGR